MRQINYPDCTEIRLKNRRILVGTAKNGEILIHTKNLIKGREIHITKTKYTREGAIALLIALRTELAK